VLAAAVLGATWIAAAAPAPAPGPDDEADEGDDDEPEVAPEDVPIPDAATGLAALDQTRTTAVGFSHTKHGRDVDVSGGAAIACVACHVVRGKGELVGRPDHRACFGACHGPAPVRRGARVEAGARARVCAACHAPAALVKADKGSWARLAVGYPPYALEADHGTRIGHKVHAQAACAVCHPAQARRVAVKPAPHARCAGCHDGTTAKPAMTGCETCHALGFGAAVVTRLLETDLRVGFTHAGHARVAPAAACAACHRGIAATDEPTLPRPTAADCGAAGCHDGTKAFSVTTACTRCHSIPPSDPWEVARSSERFSHANHAPRIAAATCASCHRLDRRGEPATVGHAACADAACHASDFGARWPKKCASCHLGTEPWRALAVEPTPLDATEHGTRIPHDRHAQPCGQCHRVSVGRRELGPPRGHAACASAGCHAVNAGPAPRLGDCAGCHQLGLAETRRRDRLAAAWSVRARFTHAPHAVDPRAKDAALECVACHDAVPAGKDAERVPTPAKARCAGCHDGAVAFKVTGTGCARCHGTAAVR
jgi:c(7)-type cytochrome triheme protein